MKRDSIKTIAGLIIIVGIVVATFMYGNSQRQKQLAHDQQIKQQQEATAREQAKSVSPNSTPSVSAIAGKTPAPAKSPAATSKTAPATGGTAVGVTTPVTGGTGAALPNTGPESVGIVGVSLVGVMLLAVRRSRRELLAAARSRR